LTIAADRLWERKVWCGDIYGKVGEGAVGLKVTTACTRGVHGDPGLLRSAGEAATSAFGLPGTSMGGPLPTSLLGVGRIIIQSIMEAGFKQFAGPNLLSASLFALVPYEGQEDWPYGAPAGGNK
jgi:hypothetical protein